MTIRDEISFLSHDVNDFLRGYVYIHNYVFAHNLRRIIPVPFFFKTIDFAKANSALAVADLGLEKCAANAKSLAESSNVEQAEYLSSLIEYVAALRRTMRIFQTILFRMNSKLDGKSYTWCDYRRDVAKYRESINGYVKLGGSLKEKLNKLDA